MERKLFSSSNTSQAQQQNMCVKQKDDKKKLNKSCRICRYFNSTRKNLSTSIYSISRTDDITVSLNSLSQSVCMLLNDSCCVVLVNEFISSHILKMEEVTTEL
ncbi:CLUMA_CG004353, isoform A [Clunio marinus]|uniref:CLUMA_CG004353, isoform A n=1 Tax=Clunio marinus TaxID=568069 RepID=A0A1J1HTE4_9DIPT|nr:CLUMA_CG004353, isoform A [Clunio marinus]